MSKENVNYKEMIEEGKKSLTEQALEEDYYESFLNENEEKNKKEETNKEISYDDMVPSREADEDDLNKLEDIKIPHSETLKPMPEIDPTDLPIFPNGPLNSQVEQWKKKYKSHGLFTINIQENMFVFRTLNRVEYKKIAALEVDALIREEVYCKTCTLWPIDFSFKSMANGLGGLPSSYANIIMQHSGFTDEYQVMKL